MENYCSQNAVAKDAENEKP